MKILVTVGTTKFPTLIQTINYIFDQSNSLDCCVDIQHADPSLTFKDKANVKFNVFMENLDAAYNNYDVIICHAGAGTVYKLLELNKKIIVVPNYDRKDHHQKDLANFIKENNYGLVLDAPCDLSYEGIINAISDKYTPFVKENFFLADYIFVN